MGRAPLTRSLAVEVDFTTTPERTARGPGSTPRPVPARLPRTRAVDALERAGRKIEEALEEKTGEEQAIEEAIKER